jgi:hypothetical protein
MIEFGTENARPRALFSQAALGPFAGLDAPVTMNWCRLGSIARPA